MRSIITNLTPASGRHDHTTSPSATAPFVLRCCRVPRVPPRVRDDREPPLFETRRRISRFDFSQAPSGIFFAGGLDFDWRNARLICPTGNSQRLCLEEFHTGGAWKSVIISSPRSSLFNLLIVSMLPNIKTV